jgi:hypothetical protein
MSPATRHPLFCASKKGTFLKIACIFFLFTFLTRATYYALAEGFSLKRIEAPISFQGDLSVKAPSKQTLETLSSITLQHFRYLKKGSQAYAFISDDGHYILKLFKLHHMQPAEWLQAIPAPGVLQRYRDNLIHRRKYRIELTLTSYKLAAEKLLKECGLVYAQVLPSLEFSLPVTIVDAVGRRYSIDLSQHGFAIQKRAELVIPSFERWIKEGDIQQAKNAIDSLVALIAARSIKGVQDSDPDLHKNAGLIGTKAVLIDIGSFYANPSITAPAEMQRDMKKVFNNFSEWLSRRSPTLADYLTSRLETPEELRWSPSE